MEEGSKTVEQYVGENMKDFPVSEKIGKMKAEREKFYDALLQKILALSSVQEYIKDLKTGETKISGVETEYDYEQSALDDFFEGDVIDILVLVEEIWNIVKEEIREEAAYRGMDLTKQDGP